MGEQVQLSRIYYGDSVGALRGPEALRKQAKEEGLRVSLAQARRFLASQPTYTLYRPAPRNYPRNHIRANVPGEIVQLDIMDMQRWRDSNDGFAYVLLAYDTYSKLLQGVPHKDRTPASILAGLETLIEDGPLGLSTIYWDKEGSFLSRQVQSFLRALDIHNYTTVSKVKAPGVERSIRTLRTAIQRHFEASGALRWLEFLPTFIANYNRRKHSTTGLPPNRVLEDPMALPPLPPPPRGLRGKKSKDELPPVGSYVRLNRLKGLFEKEASGNYTREVFRVVRHKVSDESVPMVFLEDLAGNLVRGAFYPQEFQPIVFDTKRRKVERVLETRRRSRKGRRITEFLVTFQGFPDSVTQWVSSVPLKLRP